MAYPNDILAAEDKAAADLEKEFLRSVKATVKQIDWDKLERDLTAHREDIADGLPWEEYDPKAALKNLFEVALEAHGEYIGSVTGGAIFDYVDPNALKWIEEYGAKDIKYISDASKEAIRSIIRNGYEQGVTVRNQAKQIREHIGLDPDRSRTLEKYAENLFAKGKSEAEVWRLVEKRGKALLMSRANTIAVNEASEAAGRATYQSTKSACERGVIDANLYEGFRIVTADERTCERCAPLSGEARKLPDGAYASTGQQTAKIHIKCRCVEGLRENKSAKKPAKPDIPTYEPSTPSMKQLLSNRAEYNNIKDQLKSLPPSDKRTPEQKALVNQLNNRMGEIMGNDAKIARAAHSELLEVAKRDFPKMALKVEDKNGYIDPELFDRALQDMRRVGAKFPEAIPKKLMLVDIKTGTYAQWDNELLSMRFNSNLATYKLRSPFAASDPYKLEKVLKSDVEAGFHPIGCDNFEAVVTHEMGHALERNLLTKKEIIGKWDKFNSDQGIVEGLSEYSKFGNSRGEFHERLAEGFASMYHTPTDMQCAFVKDLSNFLGDLR